MSSVYKAPPFLSCTQPLTPKPLQMRVDAHCSTGGNETLPRLNVKRCALSHIYSAPGKMERCHHETKITIMERQERNMSEEDLTIKRKPFPQHLTCEIQPSVCVDNEW